MTKDETKQAIEGFAQFFRAITGDQDLEIPKDIKERFNIQDSCDKNTGIKVGGDSVTLTEFMAERYKNREDKGNIYGVGVSDAEFRTFIIDYLLGEDWYVAAPVGQTQVNENALYQILEKYSKRYRKECKGRK